MTDEIEKQITREEAARDFRKFLLVQGQCTPVQENVGWYADLLEGLMCPRKRLRFTNNVCGGEGL